MQALLGHTNERRWVRSAITHLSRLFPKLPRLPKQPGHNNKCLRKLGGTMRAVSYLVADTGLWSNDVWIVDPTPVEWGKSREIAIRSDLAGLPEYGHCASHSRYFWGLRLHLIGKLDALLIGFALTGAKANERDTLQDMLETTRAPLNRGQTILADNGNFGLVFEHGLHDAGISCCALCTRANPRLQAHGS